MKLSTRQVLCIGLIFFLITAHTSIGYHHSDEHWQLLEFASYKLGRSPQNHLASEYTKEMRSAFQPAVALTAVRFFEGIGVTNPFHIAFALRLVSSVLAWLALSVLVVNSGRFGVSESNQKLLATISMFLWFIPYTSCRFSNENWSGFLFCFGLISLTANKSSLWKYFLAGILIGSAYLCRFQILFASIGLLLWLMIIQKSSIASILVAASGFLVVCVFGFFVDYWFYGHFTFTAYNYFYANIIEGVAASFGVSPWWYYFVMIFESAAAPLSVVILFGYAYSLFYFRLHVFHWVVFFFLAGHCLVGHKELRFLFPMVYLLPLILVSAFEKAAEKWNGHFNNNKFFKIFCGLVIIENMLLLLMVVFIKPAEETTLFNRFVFDLASTQPVVIFYVDRDPYQFGDQRQYFYCQKNLTLKRIESDLTIKDFKAKKNSALLVFDDKFEASESVKAYIGKPVFKTFPEWLRNFNVGNWLGRAKSWTLYEAKRK